MCHALVVDDDPIATRALMRLLRDDGHRVSAYEDAREALEALARRRLPNACVIIVTANASVVAPALIAEGASVVADKPLDYAGLTSFLLGWRARSHAERHAGIFLRAAPR